LGSLSLNDIVWLRSYEGMNRFNLLGLDKVSVFRDDGMLDIGCYWLARRASTLL
jgi:hypothetical protein